MKIALCSTYVPFVHGGARNIVDWLKLMLEAEGHAVEVIYLPEDDAAHILVQQVMAFKWIDLSMADRVICFRPQSHVIQHPHKILWFIHHIRAFYDLWDSSYRGYADTDDNRVIRDTIREIDTEALLEAKAVFTNSAVVAHRLKTYNNVDSEVLYPPIFRPERFHCSGYNDEIVYICRVEHHKRQHLLIEAMRHTRTPVKLRICGMSMGQAYVDNLIDTIAKYKLKNRVVIDHRWISEDEKAGLLADCLAAAYLPLDEDSYGYPSLEASHSSKPILTTTDSGGVLELVRDGYNGFVTEPAPKAIAAALDKFYLDRAATETMGQNALKQLATLNISWSHVLKRLLA